MTVIWSSFFPRNLSLSTNKCHQCVICPYSYSRSTLLGTRPDHQIMKPLKPPTFSRNTLEEEHFTGLLLTGFCTLPQILVKNCKVVTIISSLDLGVPIFKRKENKPWEDTQGREPLKTFTASVCGNINGDNLSNGSL